MRASKAVGSKNYDVAIAEFKKRIAINEKDSEALAMLAFCYEWKGERETALQYANKQLSQNPKDFQMLLLAARYWAKNNNEEQTCNYACRKMSETITIPIIVKKPGDV